MSSNAVLQDQRRIPANVVRAQLAIELARQSKQRRATFAEQGKVIELGLRAGVKVQFTPDRRNELPESFVTLVERLKEMELVQSGWDSYGGKPLSDAAVLPTIELALIGIHRCEAPDVFLRSNGGIGLRWQNGDRELEIDVNPDGKCTAYLTTSESEVDIDEPTEAENLAQLVHQVCRMS